MARARIAALYFVVQSVSIAAWWFSMLVSPHARSLFEAGSAASTLTAFAPGDLGIVVLGLYVGARRGRGDSAFLGWMIAGAMIYGALYTITLAARDETSAVGAILMTPAAVASVWAAAVLSRRASPPVSTGTGS